MSDNIEELIAEVDHFKAETKAQLEEFRLRFLSKKGKLAELFAEMKQVVPEERKNFGQRVNELKNKAEEKLREFRRTRTDRLAPSGFDCEKQNSFHFQQNRLHSC